MAEKNLPIKFFQKRKNDEQNTEGGGNSKPPKWVLKGKALSSHGKKLQIHLGQLETRLTMKSRQNNALPTLVRATLETKATAKSHRDDVVSLFNVNNKNNVIGFLGYFDVLLKIDNKKDLAEIENNIRRAQEIIVSKSVAKGISAIKELSDVTPLTSLAIEGETVFKVKLIDYHDAEINAKALELFEEICKQQEFKLETCNYIHDKSIYRLEAPSLDGINEVLEFEGLFSIEDMPSFSLTEDSIDDDEKILFKKPDTEMSYPLVGVLDTGIKKIPQLNPWIVEESETSYPDEYTNKNHGTAVASILIHGDDMEGKVYTGTGGCRVMEACIFPDIKKIGIRENELIRQIEDCIRKHCKKIRIWNLSLGTSNESSLDDFSDFGKALDSIQKECDVLIIKSVGNCENFVSGKPKARVAKSGDSVLSLVVGSLTHEKGPNDLDDVNQPSCFSRTGPAPCSIHKPDLVHMGGNGGMFAGRATYTGVRCLGADGKLTRKPGTSFSTPRVTALTAGVHHSMDLAFDPLLLKGLLIHNAKYPEEMKMDALEKIRLAGYGMPGPLSEILYNDINESTIILRDRLDRGHFINMLDFPFPAGMIDKDGHYYGEITVTLVTDPILEPKQQGGEYCQSNIEVILGTYDNKKQRDINKPTIKNEIGPEGGKNLLNHAYYSKTIMKDEANTFRNDRLLIAYEKKYHPVKKWVINLGELTKTNKEDCIRAPKQWYLNLKGVYRDHTEKKYAKEGRTPNQKFCLLITIRDPKEKGTLYNEVTQELNSFNFVHSDVKLSEQVQIKLKK
jgi:hypothetical protein